MNKSIEFIKNNIDNASTVVVAVSSGPDSMALLNLLLELRKEKKLKIVVAHINHNLREESKEEYDFTRKYAHDNKCEFEGIMFDKYDTNSIENEARERRYAFFESVLKKYKSKYLFTAHHGDDLIETILMRLTRGSSLDGYSGFKKISYRDNYVILRPLIFYTKDEILKYVEKNNIPYRIDKTNFSKKYTRNRYRLDILPLLKKEDENVHTKYLKFSEELEESSNFINEYVNNKYKDIVNKNMINIELLKKENNYIIKRIIYKYLFNIYKDDIKLIESKHIDLIIDTMNNKSNTELTLPKNIYIEKSYDVLMVKNKVFSDDYKIEITKETIFPFGKIIALDETDMTDNYVCHLDSSSIKLPIYVRNKKDGDFMEVLNMNGKKKIKDIFIDEKIKKDIRKNYPVVVDADDNILWLPGIKKSKYDSLKTGKYDIILWYKEEENNE
ncbi:MAG: tRNA lysidine(34) synthetase TilS [Bacilli bacterium]|nr:tRNA lysidine(34) synthetase TilS [Bacilli bacterium]